jgi:hypothetical protein
VCVPGNVTAAHKTFRDLLFWVGEVTVQLAVGVGKGKVVPVLT